MQPSRQYPNGIFSLLGVEPNAESKKVRAAWKNAVESVRAELKGAAKQKKSALSQRIRLLHAHHEYIFGPCSDVTERVRKHRGRLTAKKKRIVSAKSEMRKNFPKRRPEWNARRVVPEQVDVTVPGDKGKKVSGKHVCSLVANVNSKFASSYVVVAREKKALKRDKRLSRFAVVPGDLFADSVKTPSSSSQPPSKSKR